MKKELTVVKVTHSRRVIETQTQKFLENPKETKNKKISPVNCAVNCEPCSPNNYCCPDTGWR